MQVSEPSVTLVSSGLRARAVLDDSLCEILPRWIGSQRVIYNAKVAEDRLFGAQRRQVMRDTGAEQVATPLDQQYSHFKSKELTPWLYEVPSQVLRNGAYRWMQGKQRQLKGLAKAPTLRKRHDFNSVLLTSELFRFHPLPAGAVPEGWRGHEVELGTETHPAGRLRFKSKLPYTIPSMITLRRTGSGKWWLSFNFENAVPLVLRSTAELAYEFNTLSDESLAAMTLALDRNTKDNCLADSAGASYDIKPRERERLERKAFGCTRYQRALKRQVKGSANREKTKRKIARSHEYGADVRKNFAHQTSHTLAESTYGVFVFEALQIKNMVRRPKAKQDASGRWLKNGAHAKAALNKAILGSAWGQTKQFLSYKVVRRNKLVVLVPAQYSSQECSRCGHTHPDNRKGSRFVCLHCGFERHADTNAAVVQKQRGIALIRSGVLENAPKPKKRVAFRRQKSLGDDSPEGPGNGLPMSVEPGVSHSVPEVRVRRAAGCEAEN